jgi:hypothetical protein
MEWSLSGRGTCAPIHVHSHSFVAWAPFMQESFTHTKTNRYLMLIRFREAMSLLSYTTLKPQEEVHTGESV